MRERRHLTSSSRPGKRLAVAVVIVAVAAAGCGPSAEAAGKATHLSVQASAAPVEATSTAAPLVPTPPEPGPRAQPSEATTTPPPAPAPAASAPAASAPVTTSTTAPVRLQVPSIGVDSSLMDLGLQADGTLEVPPNGFPAGWYTGAPAPGELGPAIIAGHVDWDGQPGVFFELRALSPGDDIAVTRQDGSTARFRVTHVEQFDKDAFPTQAVYGDLDHAGLRLITCAGAFDPTMRSYDDNLVVFAELAGIDP